MKVLSFGEILWDVIGGVEHLGGAPFNFAAHSARCGSDSFIISRIGEDSLGRKAFDKCKVYGIDDSLIQWDNLHPTGIVDVTLTAGQPDYVIKEDVAYDFITMTPSISSLKGENFDVFYFGSLVQRNPVSANTLNTVLENKYFRYIFYDVNLRKKGYNLAIIRNSLKYCNILKLNIDEVPVLAMLLLEKNLNEEAFCISLKNIFPNIEIVVITAAEKGCYVHCSGKMEYSPGIAVKLGDAVGAGDAFSAAFMHAFVKTGDPVYAAETGNILGAFVASQTGPLPEYTNEIKHLLS